MHVRQVCNIDTINYIAIHLCILMLTELHFTSIMLGSVEQNNFTQVEVKVNYYTNPNVVVVINFAQV